MNVLPEVCLSLTHIPIYFGGDPDHLANTPNLTNILLKDVTDEIWSKYKEKKILHMNDIYNSYLFVYKKIFVFFFF